MKIKTSKPKSSIIYSGPSMIDGKPIVCIAIVQSGNIKTGNMIQTHILRADINPLEASKTGADISICGDCMHRGTPTMDPLKKTAQGRTCYVNIGQGPTVVYKAFKAGKYPQATPEQITAIGSNRMVRLGTYGDPAALPDYVIDALLKESTGHTGYTHQHNQLKDKPSAYNRMMYSADSIEDAKQAHSKGYRTFRVISLKQWHEGQAKNQPVTLPNEILCPASKESDKGVTCSQCKLCTGSNTRAKSIAIVAHGSARNKVKG